MAPNKLRDKLDDDQLDLAMMQMTEVPVSDIAQLPKGTHVDLSNNALTVLPDSFVTLTHLVKLDLSKNRLTELPEYFGALHRLRHVDLYSNQLERLPVSFGQLRALRFLDLKNNPLVPALQKAAGPCLTASDCQNCAKKVVALMESMQSQLEREREKRVVEEARAEAARKAADEAERERIRAEKKAAKERRRKEDAARNKMALNQGGDNGTNGNRARNMASYSDDGSVMRDDHFENGGDATNNGGSRGGWCRSLFMFLLGLLLVAVASGASLIWLYTGGDLSSKNLERTLPVLRRDVDMYFHHWEKRAEAAVADFKPYIHEVEVHASAAWNELKRRNKLVMHWVNSKLGPSACAAWIEVKRYFSLLQVKVKELWTEHVKPTAYEAWLWARPHFEALGEAIVRMVEQALDWVRLNGPVYYDWLADKAREAYKSAQAMING